jgi:hypothetical protein
MEGRALYRQAGENTWLLMTNGRIVAAGSAMAIRIVERRRASIRPWPCIHKEKE